MHALDGVVLGSLKVSLKCGISGSAEIPQPLQGQTGEKATKRWLEHASSVNDAAQWMPDTTVVVLCGRESGFSGFLSLASRLPNVKGLLGAKIDREAAGEKDPLFPLPA